LKNPKVNHSDNRKKLLGDFSNKKSQALQTPGRLILLPKSFIYCFFVVFGSFLAPKALIIN